MHEEMTFGSILQRMLGLVASWNANRDTREGSIIYNALAPAAVELANAYTQLGFILDCTFADTAPRDYLIQRAAERGLAPYPSTYAVLRGEFSMDVPIGSRFSLANEALNYAVLSRMSAGVFRLRCETAGSVGNDALGQLIPIDYIEGLASAELAGLLTPGEDGEDTEAFRKRYFASLKAEAFGGNVQDYKEKTNALPGVVGVKVYPAWDGGGTVRLAIIASGFSVPSPELVDEVQTAIDPTGHSGEGVGLAPIGHAVTVAGVTSAEVDIVLEITYQDDWGWEDVEPYAQAAVDAYFHELAMGWADSDAVIVRISQIETRFLDLPGVVDVANATLNGVAANLALGADEIPARGDLHD
jgi:uncharacterized phage protein gp47/JayE